VKVKQKHDLFEFRFHFHFDDSVGFTDKYFLAENYRQAKEMFDYACSKRSPKVLLDKVEKWNRWADRWENIELPDSGHLLN
jgi:hypothetical protein